MKFGKWRDIMRGMGTHNGFMSTASIVGAGLGIGHTLDAGQGAWLHYREVRTTLGAIFDWDCIFAAKMLRMPLLKCPICCSDWSVYE